MAAFIPVLIGLVAILLSLALAQPGPCELRTHNCPLLGANCTDTSSTTFTCTCATGFSEGPSASGPSCTTTDENLWPTADAMASALEAFYTNNLETLSTDLAGVPIVSFQIQRAPSVDQNGNPTTIYIASTVIESSDIPTFQPLYNNLIVRRLSVPSVQVYTTSTPRGAQLQLDSEFSDPFYTLPSPTPIPPPYSPPPPPMPEPTPVPAPAPPPPLPPGQVIAATKCPFDDNFVECSLHGDCNTTTFTCECNDNFGGPNCEDKESIGIADPNCPTSVSSKCNENARCINVESDPLQPPQFYCRCWSVYVGDGITCEDLDECLTHPCWRDGPYRAACTNVPGSYWCNCPPGFEGDGYTECVDINECEQEPSPCDPNADCANLKGSYACTCKSGYIGNGTTCTPLAPTKPPQVQIPTDTTTWTAISQKINPIVVCWSRSPSSWRAYLAYESQNPVTTLLPANDENLVTVSGIKFRAGYTGQTTYFGPGYNYAFMASSSVFDSTASMSWRVDGNVVSIAPTSSEAKYRCPKRVKLVSEITINCMEEDLQNAALALREKLITMMEDVRAAQSYPESILTSLSFDAGILECEGMNGEVTFVVSDPVGINVDENEGSMFDLLFPILQNRNLSSVALDVPGHPSLAPRPNGYNGIAEDEPIAVKKGKSALPLPARDCDIEVIWCLSWLVFCVIIGALFIVLVLIVALTFFLVKRHLRKKNDF